MDIKNILRSSFLQLFLVYSILVLAISFDKTKSQYFNFLLFSLVLGLIGVFSLEKKEEPTKISKALIIIPIILSIMFRVIPYINNPIPLGYDPGIYKYVFEIYQKSLPVIPEQNLEGWVKPSISQGLPSLASIFYSLGLSTQQLMMPMLIFFSSTTILAVYLATKEYFNEQAAVLSAFIFSISLAQLSTFTLFYYQNILAITSLLFFIYSLKKQNIFLTTLFAASTAFIHRPTFLILALIWGMQTLADRKNFKRSLIPIFLTFLLTIAIYLPRFEVAVLDVLIPSVASPGSGTFMNIEDYRLFSLSYFPLSILGAAYLLKNKQFSPIIYWFIINASIVLFQLIFFYRFIIQLDIAMIILASFAMHSIMARMGKAKFLILSFLFLGGIIVCFTEAINSKPLINEENLHSIEMIQYFTPDNAYIVSLNSYYSPWILGYSNRATIAPGLFSHDIWTEDEWEFFWKAEKFDEVKAMADMLPKPLYFYVGNHNSLIFMSREKFEDECFRKVFEDNGNYLLEYLC